jgi:hypothetical protein
VGIHPVTMFQRQVANILNLPEGVTPFNLIYIGYPAETKEARTQYDEKRVHRGPFPESGRTKGKRSTTRNEIIVEDDIDEH